jgi:hypothetical protein
MDQKPSSSRKLFATLGDASASTTSSAPPTPPNISTTGKRSAAAACRTDRINQQHVNRNTLPRHCTQHIRSYRETGVESDTDAEPSAQSKPARQRAAPAASRHDEPYYLHHAYQTGTEHLPRRQKPLKSRNSDLTLTTPTQPLGVQSQKSRSALLKPDDPEPIGTPHTRSLHQSKSQ